MLVHTKADASGWCWQGLLLTHMMSVGNAAFNRAWERECPRWIIRPEEYPHLPAVREHFAMNKYMYRKFMAREGGAPAAAAATAAASAAEGFFGEGAAASAATAAATATGPFAKLEEGMVLKKSPGNVLVPWQQRYLKFGDRDGHPILSYYKDASGTGKSQGDITLLGSETVLCDRSESDKDHPHTFMIKTSTDSEHQGRAFHFAVDSSKTAIEWVESCRRHSGQSSPRSVRLSATAPPPPILSAMELERLTLRRQAASLFNQQEGAAAEGGGGGGGGPAPFTYAAAVLQREAYSYGSWLPRYAATTPTHLYLFLSEGGACQSVIPLKGGKVERHAVNLEAGGTTPPGAFGVACALAHVALDAGNAKAKDAFIAAIEASIVPITIGK